MKPDIMDAYEKWVIPEPNSGCWLCFSRNNKYGYARIKIGGRTIGAHRISYEMSVGPIPHDFEIDHICGLTCCVNPAHLEAVTQFENKRRQAIRRDAAMGFKCPNGHARTPINIYMKPSGGKHCRQCRTDARKRHLLRKDVA